MFDDTDLVPINIMENYQRYHEENNSAFPILQYRYGSFWMKRFLVDELGGRPSDDPIYLPLIFLWDIRNQKIMPPSLNPLNIYETTSLRNVNK